ncbi:MAG: A/G-specific adenine glycosylase [Phycisphaerales bacterium]
MREPVADPLTPGDSTPGRDAAITTGLETWFPSAARDLPWRGPRTGWTGLVSEAMLQQTQVARVVPAFERFMASFPTPAALAAADEEAVLSHWQGLGYYRRARMLHRAAQVIVDEHAGDVPSDADALETLPGVGRYTAGAVASIVFGRRSPIVDGNVRRVIARLDLDARPPQDRAVERRAWKRAGELVEAASDPAVFNESLMELGATVCTPAAPRCGACPVASECRAYAAGLAAEVPPPAKPAARTEVHLHVVIAERGGRTLVEQRGESGLWARMWQMPTVEAADRLTWESIAAELDGTFTGPEHRGGFLHRTTHRDVHFDVWTARTRRRSGRWVDAEELAALPVANGHRKALALRSAEKSVFG